MLVNPPTWTQNGKYTAEQDRRLIGAIVRTEGISDSTSMRPTVVSNSRHISIGSGGAYVNGDLAASGGGGMYFSYNDGAHEVAIPIAGTMPRYDLVVLRIYDSAVSGSVNEARFEVITGTQASSPRIPAVPRTAIAICAVRVNPGATHLANNNISDQRVVAQMNGTVTGSSTSTQVTKMNQLASPTNPILITRQGTPSTLEMSTGGGFEPVGGVSTVYRTSDLPKSAPDGAISTVRGDGRMYQFRNGRWRMMAGWGPYITIGRTADSTHSGPYIGGLSLNTGNASGWGSENPRSSSDYSTYFSMTSGSTGTTLSRAGGITFRRPGQYHVEVRYQLRAIRNGTGVRSRIAGPGISQFTAADNMENYTLVGAGHEYTLSTSSTIVVSNTNNATHGKVVPWLRTSAAVRLSTIIMRVELQYEF